MESGPQSSAAEVTTLSADTTPALNGSSWRTGLQEFLETILLAVVIFLVVNTITGRYQVQSVSMEPTLHEGQYIIASKVTYWFHPPERGDIVVLNPPQPSDLPYIKRVIGLPGDQVEVHDGRVWINGVALNEPYISGPPLYNGSWTIEPGKYLVLGDNRNNSSDSHIWGLLPRNDILGKAIFRYWPLNKFGPITHYSYPELEAKP